MCPVQNIKSAFSLWEVGLFLCSECPVSALRDDAPHNAAFGINVVEGLTAVIRCDRSGQWQGSLRKVHALHCRKSGLSPSCPMLCIARMTVIMKVAQNLQQLHGF